MTWYGENKRHSEVQRKNDLKDTLREPMSKSVLSIEEFNTKLQEKYQGVRIHIYDSRGDIKLDAITVPKEKQAQGIGTKILNEIIAYADENNKRITLTPGQKDDRHGTTSRSRLVKFYKRFGFIENKGKDYSISESMFRVPRKNPAQKRQSESQQLSDYMKSEAEFLKYHNTGFIDGSVYRDHVPEKLSRPYNILVKTLHTKKGKIELRQSDERLKYIKTDMHNEIIRDANDNYSYFSDDEMKSRGLHKTDTTILAVNEKGEQVGYASNELGADGVWVAKEYQGLGIGLNLLIEFRKQYKSDRKIGQMTDAGYAMTRAYYRHLMTGHTK